MKKILFILIAIIFSMNICAVNAETGSNDSTLEKLLTGSDEERAVIYYTMASTYSELKDHKSAVEYYTKAIELNPKMIGAYVGRAKDCGDMGDWQCSLENYETLKKMYPKEHFFYHMASLYKTNTKDLDGAMKDIDKAIELLGKPDSSYYAQKAWVYSEKREYENAIEYLKKSLQINPNDGYALGLYLFMANANEDYKNVIKISRRLLKVDPAAKYNYALYATYAKALYKTGKKKQALEQIDKAIEIEPSDKDYPMYKEKMLKGEKID